MMTRPRPVARIRHALGRARRSARDWWRGETDATLFDVRDPAAVNKVLTAHGVAPVTTLPPPGRGGERVERVFDLRSDLRAVFPLARTPHPDRGRYLEWLVVHGRPDFGVTIPEILTSLANDDRAPDRGLRVTYQLNPTWQAAVPDALHPGGFAKLKDYLRREYDLAGRWFDRAYLPDPVPRPTTAGVNLVAHFRYPSGLQEAALGLARACDAAGVPTTRRDLPVLFDCDWNDRADYRGTELFDTTVYVAAVNTFPDVWKNRAGVHWRPGVRRVAVWYWELEDVPADWAARMGWPDEVWAPTAFLADAFRKVVSVPVRPMLPGVELPAFTPKSRTELGIPPGFVFLVTFDMGSVMARKNPLGALDAFRRAFPGGRPGVHMVIKVSRGSSRPADLEALEAAVAATPNATLIDRVFPRADVVALLAAADCYVSLHRAEGLGLGMAESMVLGKPVIATDYSGNRDFMPPGTAFLVDWTRAALERDYDPYPRGAHWAEPDLDHAAEHMRRVVDDPAHAQDVAAQGHAHAAEVLSLAAYAGRVRAALGS